MEQTKKIKRNIFGTPVPDVPRLRDPRYGFVDPETGILTVLWSKFLNPQISDEFGFDTRVEMGGGSYKVLFTLKAGTIIIRFGWETGQFATDFGVPYEEVGLPYTVDSIEYHVYRLLEDLDVYKGKVAPVFGTPGGAVQYHFFDTNIEDLLTKRKAIEEIT